jgi:hypothetical protein
MTRDPDRTHTFVPTPIDDPALEAGLAIAFGEDSKHPNGSNEQPVGDDYSGGESPIPALSTELPIGASDRYK